MLIFGPKLCDRNHGLAYPNNIALYLYSEVKKIFCKKGESFLLIKLDGVNSVHFFLLLTEGFSKYLLFLCMTC